MCDCGDGESLNPAGFCKDHTGRSITFSTEDPKRCIPSLMLPQLETIVDSVVQVVFEAVASVVSSFEDPQSYCDRNPVEYKGNVHVLVHKDDLHYRTQVHIVFYFSVCTF